MKDLYALAQVCKSFKEPALGQLWQSMNSCIPLLKLLPQLEELDSELVRLLHLCILGVAH